MKNQQNLVTKSDIAQKLNISANTVQAYLRPGYNGPETKTVKQIRQAAAELGYNAEEVKKATAQRMCKIREKTNRPANKIFASREAETNAMTGLRSQGYSNADIAQKCGISRTTVRARIGSEPAAIIAANKKLAGKIRSAKRQMRLRLASETKLAEYNAKVEAFNAEAAKLIQRYQQLKQLEAAAQKMAVAIKLKAATPTKLM